MSVRADLRLSRRQCKILGSVPYPVFGRLRPVFSHISRSTWTHSVLTTYHNQPRIRRRAMMSEAQRRREERRPLLSMDEVEATPGSCRSLLCRALRAPDVHTERYLVYPIIHMIRAVSPVPLSDLLVADFVLGRT
jgi:hypothetical protein